MSKYCTKCGNQISEGEKFCKQCGNVIAQEAKITNGNEQSKQFSNAVGNTYEFVTEKPTFRFMSAKITTTSTVANNLLNTSMKCRAKILSKKNLSGQINILDIASITYKQYATISLLDVFCFIISLIMVLLGVEYTIVCALAVGILWWRTLVPSLEIKTKDNKKLNILFYPSDDSKKILDLISKITGKKVDENSEIKIPFSKEPFIAAVIALAVALVFAIIFA